MTSTRDNYQEAIDFIRTKTNQKPTIGLVLGSGLGSLADKIENRDVIPYSDIPNWPASTVHGHGGNLVIGQLEGQTVIAQQGRAHFYEGYSAREITFPIRVMYLMGIQTLILTNAAGGLNTNYTAGDLMLLNDHINFIGMTGNNPLVGPNDDSMGPRFPGFVNTYDKELRDLAQQIADKNNITLHQGVYVCLSGPAFETPAEIRMLRTLGGDAVGMSTVHEVLVARHVGLRVLACSGITNEGIDKIDMPVETNHEEVLEIGKVIVPKLETIVRGILREL